MRMAVAKDTMTFDEEQPEYFVIAEDFSKITTNPELRDKIASTLNRSNYSIGPLRSTLCDVSTGSDGINNHAERLGYYAKNG